MRARQAANRAHCPYSNFHVRDAVHQLLALANQGHGSLRLIDLHADFELGQQVISHRLYIAAVEANPEQIRIILQGQKQRAGF